MKQNIYDNDKFFEGYIELRSEPDNWNDNFEIPALRSLLPDLKGKSVLDVGCGFGGNCMYFVEQGAESVIGIDISQKMITLAKEKNSDDKISYVVSAIEDYEFPNNEFDIVVSSLALHYISDFKTAIEKIHNTLKVKGELIFSIEHPIVTSNKDYQDIYKGTDGTKLHWAVKDYHSEGVREYEWLIKGVKKYHRKFDTIINELISAGFVIKKVYEPQQKIEPELPEYPSYLMIVAVK